MIDNLTKEFGIPGSIAIVTGTNGLPKVVMTHNSGAKAEVYLHGAHLTSWTNAQGQEMLFVSEKSNFVEKKPIRGGVPLAFPQFSSQGPLPQHGFARTSEWSLADTAVDDSGDVSLTLLIADSDDTLDLWPYPFLFSLNFALSANSITMTSSVQNTGDKSFNFEFAFHTYFGVSDIHKVKVEGLGQVTYVDSANNDERSVEDRRIIEVNGEIDRIYENAPDTVLLHDEGFGRTIKIEKHNMADVVVWNPWIERAKQIPDLADDDYLRFICIETGFMAKPQELASGDTWSGNTVLTSI